MKKLALPKNKVLKILVIILLIGVGLYFLPFIIGGYLIYAVFRKVNHTVLRNSIIVGLLLPTLFIGTAWATGLTKGTLHPTATPISPTMTPTSIPTVTLTNTPTLTVTAKITWTSTPTITPTMTKKPTVTPTPTTFMPTATLTVRYVAPTATSAPVVPQSSQTTSAGFSCNCAKTCSQMSSCMEAQYQLNSCGCTARDADHDGTACDAQCQ